MAFVVLNFNTISQYSVLQIFLLNKCSLGELGISVTSKMWGDY